MLEKKEDCKKKKNKNNTTITLHFSAYKHARVLMDIYLTFEISHITKSSMWPEGTKGWMWYIRKNEEGKPLTRV